MLPARLVIFTAPLVSVVVLCRVGFVIAHRYSAQYTESLATLDIDVLLSISTLTTTTVAGTIPQVTTITYISQVHASGYRDGNRRALSTVNV